MSISALQNQQIGSFLGYALLEIQMRIARKEYVAASELAYACHNLPSFQLGCEHFDWRYFHRWFNRFHELHGKLIYNYLALLDAMEAGRPISLELAMSELGEITPIAHEFITWDKNRPRG